MNRPGPISGVNVGLTFLKTPIGRPYFMISSSSSDSRSLIRSSALRRNVPGPGVQNWRTGAR